MTNKEKECPICNTYSRFIQHVKDGLPVQEAFEHSVTQLLDEAVSDIIDEAYRDGYIDGVRTIAEQVEKAADRLEFMDDESECDCEARLLDEEYKKCEECDCETKDECEVNIAKAIRRAIWEDEA